jgi:hypothetical protein
MARRRNRRYEEAISPHWAPNDAPRPAPSAPATSAPAAPAPPQYTAPDFRDATYNDVINQAWRNLGDFTAYTAGQQGLLRAQYGYTDDNFTIDPNNPFGQAQLLKRSFDQSRAGTQNSYAARGQQLSGAYGRQQNANLFNYQQSNDALQKSFAQRRAELLQALQDRTNQYGETAIGAAGEALQRSIANRNVGVTSSGAQQQSRALAGNERLSSDRQWVLRKNPRTGNWDKVRRA